MRQRQFEFATQYMGYICYEWGLNGTKHGCVFSEIDLCNYVLSSSISAGHYFRWELSELLICFIFVHSQVIPIISYNLR